MTKEDIIRSAIFTDTLFATRYFFKQNEGRKFNVGEHHKRIAEALDRVFRGETKRLIINLPPRYSKTEMAVKTFIAKGLAINPKSKYIHLSYSASLALDNSESAKDMVSSEWYRELFPAVEIKRESNSKQKWYTTAGGGVYATSSAGQVTGFGAGVVAEEYDDHDFAIDSAHQFGGAIIIDDPLKPEDASSAVVRDKVNYRFETTIRSRVNDRNTPIIVIMQRLHKRDLSGYLMEIEPDEWEVLSFPAISTDADGNEVALYPFKHTLEELYKIRNANRFVFETQYQQNPQTINEKLWLFAFNRSKHVGKVEYNPNEPLVMSFDFNRNPMTCTLFQHYDGKARGVECIRLENATTRMMCEAIHAKYGDAFYLVTGDCAGKNATTASLLNNYDVIKNYFNLSKSQMQYSGANPRLQDSRYFMNALFEQYDIVFDAERCKPAIYDFENVMADDENKPVKTSRDNASQQADFLDNVRYYFHRYFKNINQIQ